MRLAFAMQAIKIGHKLGHKLGHRIATEAQEDVVIPIRNLTDVYCNYIMETNVPSDNIDFRNVLEIMLASIGLNKQEIDEIIDNMSWNMTFANIPAPLGMHDMLYRAIYDRSTPEARLAYYAAHLMYAKYSSK